MNINISFLPYWQQISRNFLPQCFPHSHANSKRKSRTHKTRVTNVKRRKNQPLSLQAAPSHARASPLTLPQLRRLNLVLNFQIFAPSWTSSSSSCRLNSPHSRQHQQLHAFCGSLSASKADNTEKKEKERHSDSSDLAEFTVEHNEAWQKLVCECLCECLFGLWVRKKLSQDLQHCRRRGSEGLLKRRASKMRPKWIEFEKILNIMIESREWGPLTLTHEWRGEFDEM